MKSDTHHRKENMPKKQAPPSFKHTAFLFLLFAAFLICGIERYAEGEIASSFLCFLFSLVCFLLCLVALTAEIKASRK